MARSSTWRPLVGILCSTKKVHGEPAQAVFNRYAEAVALAVNADVVLLPTSPDHGVSLLDRLDGVVLTGSPSNIEARHYGGQTTNGPFDPSRDRAALRLVEAATRSHTPILGICRGLQEINVALGGTLRQDLGAADRDVVHHAPDASDAATMFGWQHDVTLRQGGPLHQKLRRTTATVNSVHYQGIERIADELCIEAEANDGTIEAVFARHYPIFAVQWHPEWAIDDVVSAAVFAIFADWIQAGRPEAKTIATASA